MKKFPKASPQIRPGYPKLMHITLPNPDPNKKTPKRHYLGDYELDDTWDKYDHLVYLYTEKHIPLVDISRFLQTKPQRSDYKTFRRLSAAFFDGQVAAPIDTSDTKSLLVIELFQKFLVANKGRWSKTSSGVEGNWENYRRLERRLKSYHALPARLFKRDQLEDWRQGLIDEGWTRDTINAYVSQVRCVFKWGVKQRLIPEDTYQSLKLVERLRPGEAKKENQVVESVPRPIYEKTLPYLQDPAKTILRLMDLTACRPSEILKMRVEEIDTDAVPGLWLYKPTAHKLSRLGEKRNVYLGLAEQELLTSYMAKQHITSGYLFPSRSHRKDRVSPTYTPVALRLAVKKAAIKAGVRPWNPYRLRHLAATETDAEYGLDVASARLGHKKTETTKRYYIDKNDRAAIMLALAANERFLSRQQGQQGQQGEHKPNP